MKEIDYTKWKNYPGYKWENNFFKNSIGNTGVDGDCGILQINKQTGEEKRTGAKREIAWTRLTALFVKYSFLVNKEVLDKANEKSKLKEFNFDKEPIETFLSQKIYYWDLDNYSVNSLGLNSPLDNCYSFLVKNSDVLELRINEYDEKSNIRIWEALLSAEKKSLTFREKLIYFPSDCNHLVNALLSQSPYKYETSYAIRKVLKDSSNFIKIKRKLIF